MDFKKLPAEYEYLLIIKIIWAYDYTAFGCLPSSKRKIIHNFEDNVYNNKF